MRAPRKALFITLMLLVAFLQSPLAIVPLAHCTEGDYIESWDPSGQSGDPFGITTDGSNIWLIDWVDDEVYKYNMVGVYVDSWDTSARSGDAFGITTDGSNIWLIDYSDKQVHKFTMAGVYVDSWSTVGHGTFNLGITTDGINIWVIDRDEDEAYKYHMNGTYVDSWDTSGQGTSPYGIATDGINIWTCGIGTDDVYKYYMNGTYVSSWDPNGTAMGITTDGVNIWTVDSTADLVHKYEGPPQIFPPSDPDLLFGAGFNASSPYVELYWNHSLVNVQFFEVQNSTDKVSWDYLGQSTTANYTDLQVVNGTERYYRVRACNQTGGEWYNSSFTDINFEKVYFTPYSEIAPVNIPQIDKIEFNTTIAGDRCMVTGAFSDAENLSGYVFWNNATSPPGGVNSSFTALAGTSDYGYANITLPASGTRMGVKYYVNDTDNNWAVDTLAIFPTILNQTQAEPCKIRNYNASSITVIVGTLNDGNLNSTFSVDEDWYNVSEINDIPGLDVRFNFTNIGGDPNCGCLDVYHSYTGHPQHDIKIQVWNFTSVS